MREIKISDVENLTVDGVDSKDYPDFSDAFFDYGEIDGRELTDEELDKLTDEYGDVVNEMAFESLI